MRVADPYSSNTYSDAFKKMFVTFNFPKLLKKRCKIFWPFLLYLFSILRCHLIPGSGSVFWIWIRIKQLKWTRDPSSGPPSDPPPLNEAPVLWFLGVERLLLYKANPMSCVFQNIDPSPPSPPGECAFVAGGGHNRRVERGVKGQYFGRRQTQLCTLPISNPLWF